MFSIDIKGLAYVATDIKHVILLYNAQAENVRILCKTATKLYYKMKCSNLSNIN